MRYCAALCSIFLIVTLAFGQGYKPKEGYVPDSATAIKIAEAVLIPIYGKKTFERERPFTAKLKGDVWTVDGTRRCPDGKGGFTANCTGAPAQVQISKIDAHILSVSAYK